MTFFRPIVLSEDGKDADEDRFLRGVQSDDDAASSSKVPVTWTYSEATDKSPAMVTMSLNDAHAKKFTSLAWHSKGDYLATVCDTAATRAGQVLIHHVPKRKSQNPFPSKQKGDVQCVAFHPKMAIFFVATKIHVSVYDLVKQALLKKLNSGAKWISSMHIHPNGDNVIVGTYDKRLAWFDLDLSDKPFKVIKPHEPLCAALVTTKHSYNVFGRR